MQDKRKYTFLLYFVYCILYLCKIMHKLIFIPFQMLTEVKDLKENSQLAKSLKHKKETNLTFTLLEIKKFSNLQFNILFKWDSTEIFHFGKSEAET